MAKVDRKPNQNQKILDYLEKHGTITAKQADENLGIMRLASRISDLKKLGYVFESEMVVVKNRHGEICRVKRYSLWKGDE